MSGLGNDPAWLKKKSAFSHRFESRSKRNFVVLKVANMMNSNGN